MSDDTKPDPVLAALARIEASMAVFTPELATVITRMDEHQAVSIAGDVVAVADIEVEVVAHGSPRPLACIRLPRRNLEHLAGHDPVIPADLPHLSRPRRARSRPRISPQSQTSSTSGGIN